MGNYSYHAAVAAGPGGAAADRSSSVARVAFERLLDLMLDQGSFPLQQLARQAEEAGRPLRALVEQGYLRRSGAADDGLSLSAAALRSSEERALLDLFRLSGAGLSGRHRTQRRGAGPEPGDEAVLLAPGDPVEHVDVSATLRNAADRGLPLRLGPGDFMVRPGEASVRGAAVLLIDLSGSMARHGKFPAARRAALALRALVRRRFPDDELFVLGFATRAVPLPGRALLEVVPRSVGLFDPDEPELRVRADATAGVPEHFTNIQDGLRMARQQLRGRASHAARQVLLITDGEPTAHREGAELVLAFPTREETVRATLAEAGRCAHEGVALSVFGLISEFAQPGLREFVERLARAGRGTSLCCSPRQLGQGLLHHFVRARTRSR